MKQKRIRNSSHDEGIYITRISILFPVMLWTARSQDYANESGSNIPLKQGESRIYFLHAGNIHISAKIMNAKNNEILTSLSPVQCTYIDVDANTYTFRAGHHSLGPNELSTEMTVKPGNTYYMVWWWNRDRRVGYHGSERGAHFMNLNPEQGKQMIHYCQYKETNLKAGVL